MAGSQVKASPVATISTDSMTMLRELDTTFANLVDLVEPSVVNIRVESGGSRDQYGRLLGRTGGEGSGVIFRPDGWIVTNDHVVAGAKKVTVVLNDGKEYPGTVRRAGDRQNDIAVIKIEATNLPAARFGDSMKVRAGQFAIAVGAPFGLENTATIGHISALGRGSTVMDANAGARAYSDMIQTDASINPGNSGGALLNVEGEVIGINTSIIGSGGMFGGSGGSVGIGFAIPSNQARLIAEMLIEKGKVTRGYLGLVPENLKGFEKREMGLQDGAIARSVENTGPAARAGIKEGDVITKIGSFPVRNQQELRNTMLRIAPGSKVQVQLIRNKQTVTTDLTIGELPKELVAQTGPTTPEGEDPGNPGDLFKGLPGAPDGLFGDDSGQMPDNSEERVPPIRQGQARLGVAVEQLTTDARAEFRIPANVSGVVVRTVEPGSVADRLGVKPGDVIQEVGGVKTDIPEALKKAMNGVKWGETRRIKMGRYGVGAVVQREQDVPFR